MRVLVVGAYGLIGRYVAARLLADGHDVVGAGRNIDAAKRSVPRVAWIKADLAVMSVADWAPLVGRVDAVINCAGALQDGPRDDLEAVHVTGVLALANACVDAGVRRFVHVSAAGIDQSPGAFGRTKSAAEKALAGLDLDWVILRPGLVFAPAAYGGSALLRGLAAFPWIIPAVSADAVVQVVSVEDVAACAARAIDLSSPGRFTATLTSTHQTALRDILRALRAWLGLAPAPVLAFPAAIGKLAAGIADSLAWLGWRSAMRSAAIAQLSAGVHGELDDGACQLGFKPRSFEDILSRWPSSVQERWFARLYFLKPGALAGLAVFWTASGVIGLTSMASATGQLTRAGFQGGFASAFVTGGSALDIALGVLVCVRKTAPLALKGMIAVTIAYLAAASVWRPDLWADPLGPLVKTVPAAILALVAMATLEDR